MGDIVMLDWKVDVQEAAGDQAGLLLEAVTAANMFRHIIVAPLSFAAFCAARRSARGRAGGALKAS
jgi:hypothetical protein